MPRKRLRKSVRASTSQERQGGSDTRLAMEGGSMRSPARMKDSSDRHAAAADWSKSFAQEVDIGRCTMLGDRESVSSGSFSDAVGGKDAVRSPVGEYSSDEQEIDEAFDHSKAAPFNLCSDESEGIRWSWASCSGLHKGTDAAERDPFLERRGGLKREPRTCVEDEGNEGSAVRPSIISVLDYRGNRRTYENYPITKMVSSNPTAPAPDSRKRRCHLQSVLQEWKRQHQAQADLTQSSLDMQYLIFSEKMNQILKKNQPNARSSDSTRYPWRKRSSSDVDCSPCGGPVTLQVSQDHISVKPISHWRMKREKHERVGPRDAEFGAGYYPLDCATPQRLRRLSRSAGFAEPSSVVSNIAGECSRSYRAMMNNVCSGRKARHQPDRPQSRRAVTSHTDSSRKHMKADRGSGQCSDVKAAVRLSWKGKFRFHILVTSSDAFFVQTKALLEAEGHVSVEPDQFDLKGQNSASPLLIILRNEDIADYISTIPRLVELKKTPGVRFAGVDQPDDVLNHTHQELFREGGFTVCDADALGSFTYDYVKRLVGFLEVLRDRSRWKWFLHYRDSRELRESAREIEVTVIPT
ncbi:protein TASOR 2-like [Conger conger]|uniref:protein TASOR 2-like n=1 Tax=Conger conger TaxID=82655 RepID=UPI002A59E3F2|nr:protein TASOR 2-like [Conger conger]